MKKTYSILTLLILSIFLISNSYSQPQYYNYDTVGGANSFPFNVAAGKQVQWLIRAGEINRPNSAPSGIITKIWFKTLSSASPTFTNLTIKLGLTTDSTLPTGGLYTGQLDTVYYRASVQLTAVTGTFISITLDRPFLYDNTKSIVIDVQQCGMTGGGFTVQQRTLTPFRRNYLTSAACPQVYQGQDGTCTGFGVNITPIVPQYFNFNTSVGTNTFPFNQTAGKMVQWLVGPGEFNQPSGAPAGNITAVYFFMGGTGATGRVFTNFTIRMGRTSLTSLPTGAFYTGQLDTVYFRASVALSSATNAWMTIPLDNPFLYYPDSSLIIEVGQCGYTPTTGQMYICQTTLSGNRRSWSVGGCPFVYTGQGAQVAHCGIYIPIPVGIYNNSNELPATFRLDQNYPNPFNPVTTISFGLPKASNVRLIIYDILGREVAVLVNEFVKAGNHSVDFDASEIASGVYLYKLVAVNFVETKKMMLIK
ncbi:MAG TPA: T9SS type A sorting domain-containing protein [Ignavibacteria bacterium]